MLILTGDINDAYSSGLDYLSNLVYNQFAYDVYGMQYKKGVTNKKLLMLLFALQSWANKEGATNVLTTAQMISVLNNILKCRVDSMACFSMSNTTDEASGCASSFTLEILDTASVDLTFENSVLSADTKISQKNGNVISVLSDGLFATGGTTIKLVTTAMFNGSNDTYNDATLQGRPLQLFYRGEGFLIYDADDPTNANGLNEWQPVSTGGFKILIPGFNVNTANNYFYLFIS
jgi:hypothetical protein